NLMRRAVALSPEETGSETGQQPEAPKKMQIGPEILDAEESDGMVASSILCPNSVLRVNDFSETDLSKNELLKTGSPKNDAIRPGISLNQAERELIEATLAATDGNRSRAAEMLGVSLRTVRNKIRAYGLPPRRSYRHE